MLEFVRDVLKRVLFVDTAPPEAPIGHEPEVFRASTKHLTYLLAAWAIRTGVMTFAFLVPVVVAIVAVVIKGEHVWVAWVLGIVFVGGFLVVAFCDYAAIKLDWEMRWYCLTDRSLRIREGVLQTREVTLTLANVQELNVSQGPIQRALGITDLIVDTAGGGGAAAGLKGQNDSHRGVLRGVDHGSDIRAKLEARVKQRRGAGLGDFDEHASATTPKSTTLVDVLRELRDESKKLRVSVGPN